MVIEGNVIRILSTSELLVNIGESDGVEKGMKFVVYEQGEEIIDPSTGDSLGYIEYKKADLFVSNAMEKMSVLKAKSISSPALISVYASLTASMYITHDGKLPVDEESINPIAPPANPIISIGDLVRQRVEIIQEDDPA